MSKLMKSKQVNLERYTLLELMFLFMEIIRELKSRKEAIPKLINELNQKTYDYTHEIEFGELKSVSDKVKIVNQMQDHFSTRRIAKQESIVLDEVLDVMEIDFNKIIGRGSSAIVGKQRYFKHSDQEPLVKGSVWVKFYHGCLKPYMRGK